jgi:heme A synthase
MKNPSLYRFALLVAGITFVLILAGATQTSIEGLPTAGSSTAEAPSWIGTAHRFLAYLVTVLTIPLLWLARRDDRGWLTALCGTAVILCALEAIWAKLDLGAPGAGFLHALLAQLLFTIMVVIAMVASGEWEEARRSATVIPKSGSNPMPFVVPGLVCLQVVLGDAYRHRSMGVILHILNAMIVALVVFIVGMLITRRPTTSEFLRRAANALMVITGVQIMLGFAVFILLMMFPHNNMGLVLTSVAHVLTGTLTLAASVAFALSIRLN